MVMLSAVTFAYLYLRKVGSMQYVLDDVYGSLSVALVYIECVDGRSVWWIFFPVVLIILRRTFLSACVVLLNYTEMPGCFLSPLGVECSAQPSLSSLMKYILLLAILNVTDQLIYNDKRRPRNLWLFTPIQFHWYRWVFNIGVLLSSVQYGILCKLSKLPRSLEFSNYNRSPIIWKISLYI